LLHTRVMVPRLGTAMINQYTPKNYTRPDCPDCGGEMFLKMAEKLEPQQERHSYRCRKCNSEISIHADMGATSTSKERIGKLEQDAATTDMIGALAGDKQTRDDSRKQSKDSRAEADFLRKRDR
jgi:DNA-directed RNA polymerase subunit RPC12/RpoP